MDPWLRVISYNWKIVKGTKISNDIKLSNDIKTWRSVKKLKNQFSYEKLTFMKPYLKIVRTFRFTCGQKLEIKAN